ncbi:MAG: hypothetical protein K9H16_14895 [Bacteroidales bacterium]|nr:hypothetical protein [Bacteroidales bacterium]
MEIFYGTKETNNKRREEEFLKLTPGERLIAFIEMVTAPSVLPLSDNYEHPNDKKNNFVIRKKDGKKL